MRRMLKNYWFLLQVRLLGPNRRALRFTHTQKEVADRVKSLHDFALWWAIPLSPQKEINKPITTLDSKYGTYIDHF